MSSRNPQNPLARFCTTEISAMTARKRTIEIPQTIDYVDRYGTHILLIIFSVLTAYIVLDVIVPTKVCHLTLHARST
jgi:hypothetical protein